jgi:hypothetical protein
MGRKEITEKKLRGPDICHWHGLGALKHADDVSEALVKDLDALLASIRKAEGQGTV